MRTIKKYPEKSRRAVSHRYTLRNLNGQKVLRMCTINPRTTEKDICDTVNLLKQLASDENAEAVFGAKTQKEERYWHSA